MNSTTPITHLFASRKIYKWILGILAIIGISLLSFFLSNTTTGIEINRCTINSGSIDVPLHECEQLLYFYNATNGDHRNNTTGRGTTPTLCSRHGISCSENSITHIILESNNLEGTPTLSGLTNLQYLRLGDNVLTDITLLGLSSLQQLFLNSNQLTSLNLTGLTGLQEIYLSSNQFTGIDLSELTGLQILNLVANSVTSINLSGLTNLQEIYLSENQLTGIDLAGLINLQEAYLQNNQITSLNLSGLTELKDLYLFNNQLTGIDLTGLTGLQQLILSDNLLTSIDLAGLTNLQEVYLSNNQLTEINLAELTGLNALYLNNNLLTSIDVSGLTNLQEVYLSNNQLTEIDLTGLTGLNALYLNNNLLTSIDLAGLTGLQQLILSTNLLTTLPESTTGLINLSFLELDYNCRDTGSMSSELITFLDNKAGSSTWQSNNNPACVICGNNIIEGSEECDGDNLNGETCESLGYDTGTLNCSSCTFDVNACTFLPVQLPDELDEICTAYEYYTQGMRYDARDLVGNMIERNIFTVDQFPYPYYIGAIAEMEASQVFEYARYFIDPIIDLQGMLPLNDEIEFRNAVDYLEPMMLSGPVLNMSPFSGTIYNQGIANICTPPEPIEECGNGIIEGDEQCDYISTPNSIMIDLNGQTCITLGRAEPYYNRYTALQCNLDTCMFDTSNCIIPSECQGTMVDDCTDIAASEEACAEHYNSQGVQCRYSPRMNICSNDGVACIIPTIEENYCGNDIIEGDEECDGDNLNEQTCSTFGYSLGTLSCTPSCTIDTSNCSNPPSGGGGGGGGSTPLYPDNCPDGDFSPSYYDGTCGTPPQQPSHGSAETSTTTEFKDTALTRKALAQLASTFAQEVLELTPNKHMPCAFSDINKLSTSEQQAIIKACQLNIMGLHKNGLDIKMRFEPNTYVNEKEFAAVLSRIIYDGKYNLPLNSPTNRRVNHVTQITKIGLMPTGPQVMLSFAIDTFTHIQNNLELIQRSEPTAHAAATTNTQTIPVIINNPAQAISNATKALLQDLSKFFDPSFTPNQDDENDTHGSATGEDENTSIDSSTGKLLEDLSKFF